MGATLEIYRSRIGCYENYINGRNSSSWLKNKFWNQLLLFYVNVFYLPYLKHQLNSYKYAIELSYICDTHSECFTMKCMCHCCRGSINQSINQSINFVKSINKLLGFCFNPWTMAKLVFNTCTMVVFDLRGCQMILRRIQVLTHWLT